MGTENPVVNKRQKFLHIIRVLLREVRSSQQINVKKKTEKHVGQERGQWKNNGIGGVICYCHNTWSGKPTCWDQLWLTQSPEEVVNHADIWRKKQQVRKQEVGSCGLGCVQRTESVWKCKGGTVIGLMGPGYSSCILNEMESHWKFEQRSTCQPSYSLKSFWLPYGE